MEYKPFQLRALSVAVLWLIALVVKFVSTDLTLEFNAAEFSPSPNIEQRIHADAHTNRLIGLPGLGFMWLGDSAASLSQESPLAITRLEAW